MCASVCDCQCVCAWLTSPNTAADRPFRAVHDQSLENWIFIWTATQAAALIRNFPLTVAVVALWL